MNKLLVSVHRQLRFSAGARCVLAGISAGFMALALDLPLWGVVLLIGFAAGLTAWYVKPGQSRREEAIRLLHGRLENTEYSLDLLGKDQLNSAEQLQVQRLAVQLEHTLAPRVFHRGLVPYLVLFMGALGMYFLRPSLPFGEKAPGEQTVMIADPGKPGEMPRLLEAWVHLRPPAYTGRAAAVSRNLQVSALAGTLLRWEVRFSNPDFLRVSLSNTRGEEREFSVKAEGFEYVDRLVASGLYALRAYYKDSLIYQSDYYRLEAIADAAPRIEPESKELYQFHFLQDPKTLALAARVSDDFLVKEVYLVATVARGSGENVKFREVKFPVSTRAFKAGDVRKSIDLEALRFAPGDELYYYWAAIDNKAPEPNFSKSDTYFLVYKDTSALREGELATLAVNILPEYFRSQRQIIIDTEKLIAQRGKMVKKEFNSASNEIGFDQKALRIRYGQYLGEEYESSIGGHSESEDPLEGFMHKHDSEEEGHHDHSHSHEDKAPGKASEGTEGLAELLEAYVHSHDDTESNTFYEQSTRSILKTALENMWQSELYLRLYEPEKALPYAYQALELLKEVQQKARVFIAKTSYDPPPIKEQELRMKGELKKFNQNYRRKVQLSRTQISALAGRVIGFMEQKTVLLPLQKEEVALLSHEITEAVLHAGPDQWKVLALLQKLLNAQVLSASEKNTLKTALVRISAIQKSAQPPAGFSDSRLEEAFWKNLP